MSQFCFRKTHDMDKEQFATLLRLAKGGRTYKDFAELCGVNPSTFTRIIQQVNKGSSSPELLEAIAKQAVPNSNVTLESLAFANGYTLEKTNANSRIRSVNEVRQTEQTLRTIVCQELIERGQDVRLTLEGFKIGKHTKYIPDILIRTNAFWDKIDDSSCLWGFEYILSNITCPWRDEPDQYESYCNVVRNRVRVCLERFALASTLSIHHNQSPRFSLVVTDQEVFDIIVDDVGETVFNIDVTLILIDTYSRYILNEFMFPLRDVRERVSFFMTTKTIDYANDCSDNERYCSTEDFK